MQRTVVLAILIMLAGSAGLWGQRKREVVEITIKDRKFTPAKVTIQPGDAVRWINRDNFDHTVDAKDGSFSSGTIKSGKSYEHTFPKAGDFAYECSLHPRMKGTVVVLKK